MENIRLSNYIADRDKGLAKLYRNGRVFVVVYDDGESEPVIIQVTSESLDMQFKAMLAGMESFKTLQAEIGALKTGGKPE